MTGSFEALVGRRVRAHPRLEPAFSGEAAVVGWRFSDFTGRLDLLVECEDGRLVFADSAQDILMVPK